MRPGYFSSASATPGVSAANACPGDFYRTAYTAYDQAAAATCTACPAGMRTMPNVTAATSKDQCLAPPGYGFDAATGTASICPRGKYNPGWNREACTSCGNGAMTTDGQGSTTPDDCYTPAGYGSSKATDGVLSAAICPLNTYGVPNNTYGLYEVACTKCLDHSSTNFTGATRAADCLVNPGFGYYSGSVLQCGELHCLGKGGAPLCMGGRAPAAAPLQSRV